jgi:hypothetical protein
MALLSIHGYGSDGRMPRGSGRPADVVAVVVSQALGGEFGLFGVVAGERFGLWSVVVVAAELLDELFAVGADVDDAPVTVVGALEAYVMIVARGVAIAGG